MTQFDVYKNSNKRMAAIYPYLVDIQSDFLNSLHSRLVIPLLQAKRMKNPLTYLNPIFIVENKKVILLTQEMSSIDVTHLNKKVASLCEYRDDIIRSLDFIITGI